MLPVMEIVLPTVSSNVPAFLAKLWKMVDDEETPHLISWSDEGNSFIIHNQADFAQKLLPYYYKHSNMASFVRQLNMYGFHKVLGIDSGGLKSERGDQMEFAHPYFLRGQGHLLDQIKRKISAGKSGGSAGGNISSSYTPSVKSERVTEVLNEVHQIKDRQDDIDGKLDSIKKENEALWTEVVALRKKHQSQQKIVNKLIQFLVSLVQPRMSGKTAVKRHYNLPLALEGEPSSAKESRLSDASGKTYISGRNVKNESDEGPIIKDVTHVDFSPPSSSLSGVVETPFSPMQPIDPSLVNPAIQTHFTVKQKIEIDEESPTDPLQIFRDSGAAPSHRPTLNREISKEDIDCDMNSMQKDLDNLKDILSGQVTLDTSIVSNIFNPEEPLYSFVPSSGNSCTPLIDDLLRSMNTNSKNPGQLSPNGNENNNKLQLECEPILLELDEDDQASSSRVMGKKSILKINSSKLSEHEDISELNTPAVYVDDNPLLSQLNGTED